MKQASLYSSTVQGGGKQRAAGIGSERLLAMAFDPPSPSQSDNLLGSVISLTLTFGSQLLSDRG